MDSDDERLLQATERRNIWGEHQPWSIAYRLKEDKHLADRLSRFLSTMRGFHLGATDLAGRHERRYTSLRKRWDDFSSDVQFIKLHSTRVGTHDWTLPQTQQKDNKGESVGPLWKPNSEAIEKYFESFQRKWRLRESWPISWYINNVDSINRDIAANSPIFQRICLTHLPVEIIHIVMAFSGSSDARQLGNTCKLFREISLSYIYGNYHIRLASEKVTERPDTNRYFLEMHALMLEEIEYLMSRPDIRKGIHHLRVSDHWLCDLPKPSFSDKKLQGYYDTLRSDLRKLIPELPNLHAITLNGWGISLPMMSSILRHDKIRSIKFNYCAGRLSGASECIRLSPVDLAMLDNGRNSQDLWLVLYSLPNIRSLTISGGLGPAGVEPCLPSASLRTGLNNPFLSLERFIAHPMMYDELRHLITWMNNAKGPHRNQPLRLTHFKLMLDGGMDEEEVKKVLNALRGSPLRVLSLGFLSYVDPELMGFIANTCPDLTALTLVTPGDRFAHDAVDWNSPSWMFARVLSRFSRLKHLVWYFPHDYIMSNDPTTYVLHFFENGFPTKAEWDANYAHLDIENFNDATTVARCLGANCPSLETIAFFAWYPVVYRRSKADGGWYLDGTSATKALISHLNPKPSDTDWPKDWI
ncbi:hypothetical protein QCA50_011439 [Cerrena zonata]|uniref:F-box domain-containing protein n=1 Tax=Cerrena zonata TaxID=2478898 RepID=A0AAW0G761_9APHY